VVGKISGRISYVLLKLSKNKKQKTESINKCRKIFHCCLKILFAVA